VYKKAWYRFRFLPEQRPWRQLPSLAGQPWSSFIQLPARPGVRMARASLPLAESLMVAWPQIVALASAVILLFVASYVAFQRQEVRA
jgi:hypothetical protein